MSLAYYNEHDPYAAAWLRNLIAAGHIAPGVVDERDLRDIRPEELIGFTQCHFFAGIGVWPYALRRAGISDDQPLWSGSCPCQPFSAAGRGGGVDDERHLWPHWHWLISQCRPPVVVGEQVASKDGLGWLDLVSADMEGTSYAFGAVDLCAAGVGVEWQDSQAGEWLRRAIHDCADPVIRDMLCDFADWAGAGNIGEGGHHIRQRLYFVGLADSEYRLAELDERARPGPRDPTIAGTSSRSERHGHPERMDDDDDARSQGHAGDDRPTGREGPSGPIAAPSVSVGLADPRPPFGKRRTDSGGPAENGSAIRQQSSTDDQSCGDSSRPEATDGIGRPVDWLFCRDGKWRATRSGAFPLAHGATARVGRLRAYGNALDAETAFNFCQVVKELTDA